MLCNANNGCPIPMRTSMNGEEIDACSYRSIIENIPKQDFCAVV
jgi:hypothetical protein